MSDAYTIGPASGGVGQAQVTVSISYAYSGNSPATIASFTLTNSFSVLYEELKTLASGANTISVPDQAGGVWLVPPAGNVNTLLLKGVTGDTGISLHLTAPCFLAFALGTSRSFCLTASGSTAGFKLVWC